MSSTRNASVSLFLVSCVTLVFELTQVRVFSFSLHPLIAYSAIAIAMLGFGLGSTFVVVRPAWFQRTEVPAICTLLFAASMPLVSWSFSRTSPSVFPADTLAVDPIASAVALLPCALPYALSGIVVTLVLRSGLERIGRVYFWNLAGSALGCMLATSLLRHLGAERVVALCGLVAAIVGLLIAPAARPLQWISAVVLSALGFLVPWAPRVFAFQPDASDMLYLLAARSGRSIQREMSMWDPVGRIDFLRHDTPFIQVEEPVEYRTITNDSGAMSLLIRSPRTPGWGKEIFEQTLYAAPYLVRSPSHVLVIGVGGGHDINTALHWNAGRVTGVDVSRATLDALRGPYAGFAQWPLDPRVSVVHEDGRTFARRTRQRFGLVQLTGVDTFTLHSAGSMVTAEDYLYTREAFSDFLALLEPDGMLAVTRFGDEAMNLSAIAVSAMRGLGIQEPQRCIVALQQSGASGVIAKRTPFSDAELERLLHIEDRQTPTKVRIPHYDDSGHRASDPVRVLYPQGRAPDARYGRFFEGVAQGEDRRGLREAGSPFVVPSDDRPYYMLGTWVAFGGWMHPVVAGMFTSTLAIAAGAVALMLLPLLRRRNGAGLRGVAPMAAYFFAIGAAFMILEIGLIHRTVVVVGSPGAAVSLVMATILLAASAGAAVSDRVANRTRWAFVVATVGMLVVGLLHHYAAGRILDASMGLSQFSRGAVVALLLAPAGFFAGWFFPLGMRSLAAWGSELVPWAIAINAFASVIGSLATLYLGVMLGFRTMFLTALVGYAAAGLAHLWMARMLAVDGPVT